MGGATTEEEDVDDIGDEASVEEGILFMSGSEPNRRSVPPGTFCGPLETIDEDGASPCWYGGALAGISTIGEKSGVGVVITVWGIGAFAGDAEDQGKKRGLRGSTIRRVQRIYLKQ